MNLNLYDAIGFNKIEEVLRLFYDQAVIDPLLAHFFFEKDIEELIQKQLVFTSILLGAKNLKYQGKPLKKVHERLNIRKVHLARRNVLMGEVMAQCGLPADLATKWQSLEQSLNSQISKDEAACND